MLCVLILNISGGVYSLKSTPKSTDFLRNFFKAGLFTLRVFARNLLRGNRRRNRHYNPSVRIIDLLSHATYVVCVHFIHKWRDLQFTSLLITFRISFSCLAWDSNPRFSSNKPIHYLLDHGDFALLVYKINTHNMDAIRS